MATLYGKLAASAPWRAGNSKMARVQERAHASLLGEGQDEGVLSERINRIWYNLIAAFVPLLPAFSTAGFLGVVAIPADDPDFTLGLCAIAETERSDTDDFVISGGVDLNHTAMPAGAVNDVVIGKRGSRQGDHCAKNENGESDHGLTS
jgi:hypothetical protein